jgi:membrane protein
MARLRDVVKISRSIGLIELARRVHIQIFEDNLFTWAAALAYSWLFALFPFLLFVLALIPHLPENLRDGAQNEVRKTLVKFLPKGVSDTLRDNIEGNLKNILHQQKGLMLYVGLIVALYAASSGMAATMSALDCCYDLTKFRPFLKQRWVALVLTVVVMVMLLVVACLLPVGTAVRHYVVQQGWMARHSPLLIAFDIVRWTLAMAFLMGALAVVYDLGPNVRQRFFWITPGSFFCAAVWVLLGVGFRLYMDRIGAGLGYDRTYGALGGVAILLLLFYVDGLVLLIGAEINSEIDFQLLNVKPGTHDLRHAQDDSAITAI